MVEPRGKRRKRARALTRRARRCFFRFRLLQKGFVFIFFFVFFSVFFYSAPLQASTDSAIAVHLQSRRQQRGRQREERRASVDGGTIERPLLPLAADELFYVYTLRRAPCEDVGQSNSSAVSI